MGCSPPPVGRRRAGRFLPGASAWGGRFALPAGRGDEGQCFVGQVLPVQVGLLPGRTARQPGVQRILGRAPRPFADWAARNTAAFR